MRNKFPGVCCRCHKMVEKGQGHFEKVTQDLGPWINKKNWRVQHAECAIKYRGTKYGVDQNTNTSPAGSEKNSEFSE